MLLRWLRVLLFYITSVYVYLVVFLHTITGKVNCELVVQELGNLPRREFVENNVVPEHSRDDTTTASVIEALNLFGEDDSGARKQNSNRLRLFDAEPSPAANTRENVFPSGAVPLSAILNTYLQNDISCDTLPVQIIRAILKSLRKARIELRTSFLRNAPENTLSDQKRYMMLFKNTMKVEKEIDKFDMCLRNREGWFSTFKKVNQWKVLYVCIQYARQLITHASFDYIFNMGRDMLSEQRAQNVSLMWQDLDRLEEQLEMLENGIKARMIKQRQEKEDDKGWWQSIFG